jgi:hypothetical protein
MVALKYCKHGFNESDEEMIQRSYGKSIDEMLARTMEVAITQQTACCWRPPGPR